MQRRRQRKTDFLASPSAVRNILAMLRKNLLDIMPSTEKGQVQMLRAARHISRHTASNTNRGRKSKFKRKDLIEVSHKLQAILKKEATVGVSSFVDHYLRILEFPADLVAALESGEINLYEAEQLCRVKDRHLRLKLKQAHLDSRSTTASLRQRIGEVLGEGKPQVENGALDFEEEFDPTHLLFDQLRQIEIALKEIHSEDVTEEQLDEILAKGDELLTSLTKIKRRKPVEAKLET